MLLSEKSTANQYVIGGSRGRVPLRDRPLDAFYFGFFFLHLFTTLYLDAQPFYPPSLIPKFMSSSFRFSAVEMRDPLVGGMLGIYGEEVKASLTWFTSFIWCEAFLQTPLFIYALHTLWHQNLSSYLFLALYGVHSATTILPCLVLLYNTPSCGFPTLDVLAKPCLFRGQRVALLLSYGAFFVIALLIAVEVSLRCLVWVRKGVRAEEDEKEE